MMVTGLLKHLQLIQWRIPGQLCHASLLPLLFRQMLRQRSKNHSPKLRRRPSRARCRQRLKRRGSQPALVSSTTRSALQ